MGAEVRAVEPVDGAESPLWWLDIGVWFAGDSTASFSLLCGAISAEDLDRADPAGVIGTVAIDGHDRQLVEALAHPATGFHVVRALFPELTVSTVTPLRSAGTSSSAVLDEDRVVKVVRHADLDPNPDVEVPDRLHELGFDGAQANVAVYRRGGRVAAYVRPQSPTLQDGVALVVGATAELFQRRKPPAELRTEVVREMRAMGLCVAATHLALADGFGSPAADGAQWRRTLMEHARRRAGTGPRVDRLDTVLARLDSAEDLGRSIRLHRHLHLGNMARTTAGWQVVNFEGDGRPFREVRAMGSPLQDLSRLISSIELTGRSVLPQFLEGDEERDRELSVLLEALEQRMFDALIDGYGTPTGIDDLLPSSSDNRDALLSVFETQQRIDNALPDPGDTPWTPPTTAGSFGP